MIQLEMKSSVNRKTTMDISILLRDLASLNKIPNYRMSSSIAPFTFPKPPNIAVEVYVERLIIYSLIETSSLISTFIYIDRFLNMCDVKLCINNIHRIFLTAMVISIKYNQDIHFKNDIFSKIGGISLEQFNRLESIFLQTISFQLFISEEEYNSYYCHIDYLIMSKRN
jgi:hypothetical protein